MSYNYTLEINTELDRFVVLRILFPTVINYRERPGKKYIDLVVGKMPVVIAEITDEEDVLSAGLGIFPNIDVSFSLKGTVGSEIEVLEATLRWLKQREEDMVLLANYSGVVLMRKNGELIRNGREEFWTPEMLSLITLPHKVEIIPEL